MGNNQSNHFPHIPEKVTWSLNTIINGKSQTLLSDFFLRGGAAVHRLAGFQFANSRFALKLYQNSEALKNRCRFQNDFGIVKSLGSNDDGICNTSASGLNENSCKRCNKLNYLHGGDKQQGLLACFGEIFIKISTWSQFSAPVISIKGF